MEVTFCLNWHSQLTMECNNQVRLIKRTDKSYKALLEFIGSRMWKYENIDAGFENEFDSYFEEVFTPELDNGSAYLINALEL